MKHRIVAVMITSFFLSQGAFAHFEEVQTLDSIRSSVNQDTLLVFDIDNTLIEPTTSVGSDQWFYSLYKPSGKKPLEDPALDIQIMNQWNEMQSQVRVKAVEAATPAFIRNFQKRGIKMMAITARTPAILGITLKQLKSVGIEFAKHSVSTQDLEIPREQLLSHDSAFFKQGILSVGESNDKGKVLARFLKAIHFKPKKIVFVDDKLRHVKAVELAMEQEHLPFHGFRYGALDEKVRAFQSSQNFR